jgi:H+/Cl- antiporter ClcA
LRDFTVDGRVWLLTLVALFIGAGGAALAVLLLRAIALSTNLFYYHRLSLAMVGPAGSPLSPWLMALVPVVGGMLVGLMAHFGSEKIRGHGIPEAIEAILLHGARVDPKVAILKPISAAIAIGSGGPFGAEGPIIMTGGAFGSLVAQWLKLTDAERTTLLVAGAAAGMSATFAAPLAAILLAVELLLFEWRPRSLVPVAAASIMAGALRIVWLGAGPLFPVQLSSSFSINSALLVAAPLGILVGLASAGLSRLMYSFEDGFEHFCGRVKLHWMWWPAIGGMGIGLGGFFFPRGLGVGYDNIAAWPFDCEVADVGVLTEFGNVGRCACAAADDWRGHRRNSGQIGSHAGRGAGALGIAGDGGNALRRAGRAAHGNSFFSGADPCPARAAAAGACMHFSVLGHLPGDAAFHSD